MRYIIVPKPVTIAAVQKDGAPLSYSFDDFHREHVWTAPQWRDGSRDAAERFASCHEKISSAKPCDVVALTDEEFETYAPIATLRGIPLPAQAAVELSQLMRPILLAPKEKPGEAAG